MYEPVIYFSCDAEPKLAASGELHRFISPLTCPDWCHVNTFQLVPTVDLENLSQLNVLKLRRKEGEPSVLLFIPEEHYRSLFCTDCGHENQPTSRVNGFSLCTNLLREEMNIERRDQSCILQMYLH